MIPVKGPAFILAFIAILLWAKTVATIEYSAGKSGWGDTRILARLTVGVGFAIAAITLFLIE